MTHAVRLAPLAIEDLTALHRWIAGEAGPETASGYIDRIEERITSLSHFPDRGTPRDDLVTGLRTLAFERRLTIAYTVVDRTVTVLRIIDGARELGPIFANPQ